MKCPVCGKPLKERRGTAVGSVLKFEVAGEIQEFCLWIRPVRYYCAELNHNLKIKVIDGDSFDEAWGQSINFINFYNSYIANTQRAVPYLLAVGWLDGKDGLQLEKRKTGEE